MRILAKTGFVIDQLDRAPSQTLLQLQLHATNYISKTPCLLMEPAGERATAMADGKPKLHEGLTLKVNQNGPRDREEAMETVTEKLHKVRLDIVHHSNLAGLIFNRRRTVKQTTKTSRSFRSQHVS